MEQTERTKQKKTYFSLVLTTTAKSPGQGY